jgi:hypothetical protein
MLHGEIRLEKKVTMGSLPEESPGVPCSALIPEIFIQSGEPGFHAGMPPGYIAR